MTASNNLTKISHTIENITESLSKTKVVRTVILIGSHARGDSHDYSDIDLVVITDPLKLTSWFYSIFPNELNIKELSLLPYSSEIFKELYHEGSLFIAHVLKEGKVLYDEGYFSNLIKTPFKVKRESLLLRWDIIKQRIGLYDDLSLFGNVFVDPLSHLYPITANIAILALALRGELIFNKDKALERFSFLYPEISNDISELKKLKAFWLIWSKNAPISKPFSPIYSRDQTENYLRRLRRVMSMVERNEIRATN